MKILMCSPDFYGIEYEINPWMKVETQVDHVAAVSQWKKLYQTIIESNAEVALIEPIAHWPDMVFTANAGLPFKGKIILSHFKYKERQGEVPYFKKWFENENFEIQCDSTVDTHLPFFEGAGDALFAGQKLFVGYGFRTERRFYEENAILKEIPLVYCELSNPYFYHIDTCFCPLNESQAIWYPNAFTPDSQKRMSNEIELIEVRDEEAKHFACNAVVLDRTIIIPEGCPDLTSKLRDVGLIVKACNMSEFIKAGGACKCLTLKLD